MFLNLQAAVDLIGPRRDRKSYDEMGITEELEEVWKLVNEERKIKERVSQDIEMVKKTQFMDLLGGVEKKENKQKRVVKKTREKT